MYIVGTPRIVVNISNLMNLLPKYCQRDSCQEALSVTTKFIGSVFKLKLVCSSGHVMEWASSDPHYDKKGDMINENDLLFAAAILYSGNHYAKVSHFCSIFGLRCIGERMFYRYQRLYLVPTVEKFWKLKSHQTEILQK